MNKAKKAETDSALAAKVRSAADTFAAVVDEAARAGLTVSFDIGDALADGVTQVRVRRLIVQRTKILCAVG